MNLNHFIKHKFKDTWYNLSYYFKANRRAKNYMGGDRSISPPENYKIVFEDNFKTPLNTDQWGYGQRWGDFHPDVLSWYYDNDGTYSYTTKDGLALELRNVPKTWVKSELPEWRQASALPDQFTIPIAAGMVSSKQSWQYGWFEAWIKLPKGTPYWPAFWLTGKNSWPPEIDIFEAYSQFGNRYESKTWFGKLKPNRKIQPNLHYGSVENNTKEMYGSWDIPVAECTERYVQYACLWEEDRIEIYYDGAIVFKCTDPKILATYNKENAEQIIILNHGYYWDKPDIRPDETAMLIKSVKVLQKN